jgi:hypothetical protein
MSLAARSVIKLPNKYICAENFIVKCMGFVMKTLWIIGYTVSGQEVGHLRKTDAPLGQGEHF